MRVYLYVCKCYYIFFYSIFFHFIFPPLINKLAHSVRIVLIQSTQHTMCVGSRMCGITYWVAAATHTCWHHHYQTITLLLVTLFYFIYFTRQHMKDFGTDSRRQGCIVGVTLTCCVKMAFTFFIKESVREGWYKKVKKSPHMMYKILIRNLPLVFCFNGLYRNISFKILI